MSEQQRGAWVAVAVAALTAALVALVARRPWWTRCWALLLWAVIVWSFMQAAVLAAWKCWCPHELARAPV